MALLYSSPLSSSAGIQGRNKSSLRNKWTFTWKSHALHAIPSCSCGRGLVTVWCSVHMRGRVAPWRKGRGVCVLMWPLRWQEQWIASESSVPTLGSVGFFNTELLELGLFFSFEGQGEDLHLCHSCVVAPVFRWRGWICHVSKLQVSEELLQYAEHECMFCWDWKPRLCICCSHHALKPLAINDLVIYSETK